MATEYLRATLLEAETKLREAAGIIRELIRDRVLAGDTNIQGHLAQALISTSSVILHVNTAALTIQQPGKHP